jgi:hypothetical protein
VKKNYAKLPDVCIMYEEDSDVPSFMFLEDGFFSIGCKESQRRLRLVGRLNAEDCCPSLAKDLQRSLLPGEYKGKHSHNKEGGSYADTELQEGNLRTHGARADVGYVNYP